MKNTYNAKRLDPQWREKLTLDENLMLLRLLTKVAMYRAKKFREQAEALATLYQQRWQKMERTAVKVKILKSIVLSNKLGLIRPEDL